MLPHSEPGRAVFHSRWDMELIALALMGECRFGGFQRRLRISRKVLSDRLRHLVAEGFFERRPYQSRPQRYEYVLTAKGSGLRGAVEALEVWAQEWCPAAENSRSLVDPHR